MGEFYLFYVCNMTLMPPFFWDVSWLPSLPSPQDCPRTSLSSKNSKGYNCTVAVSVKIPKREISDRTMQNHTTVELRPKV